MKRKIRPGNNDPTAVASSEKRSRTGNGNHRVPEFLPYVHTQINILNSLSDDADDRSAAVAAAKIISGFAQNESMLSTMADVGVVQALVKRLEPPHMIECDEKCNKTATYGYQVEKECAKALSLLAVDQPWIQRTIVDFGAVPRLINLMSKYKSAPKSVGLRKVIRWAANAITNLAHENDITKKCIRAEGAIPVLVGLLDFLDIKAQRAALGALRTLAFRNNENKNQIVECNGLSRLVLLLQSEDVETQTEAVGTVGNLVHSSPRIKELVLLGGALQPVLGLLRSPSVEIQKEAALLVGQFAGGDGDIKAHIAQRGAIPPLLDMLQSEDDYLKETASFSLGRLAQDKHNQAGIAQDDGLQQILNVFGSKNRTLQHNAAFTLFGLADNEDNTSLFVTLGGVKLIQDAKISIMQTKACLSRTLQRLEEKMTGRVVHHLIYLMHVSNITVQTRVALAFAHLCSPQDQRLIFIDNNGLEILLSLVQSGDSEQQQDGFEALCKLASKSTSMISTVNAGPPSPTQQVPFYLDADCVNNSLSSDVTFLVEGEPFYAHRKCLLASDAFRAMLEGGFRERNVKHIEIPNITREVFELMMRYLYTGSVDVKMEMSQDLLVAADQYLLDGLKKICECTIAQGICEENVLAIYELSEEFNAMSLKESCIMYLLEQHVSLRTTQWYPKLIQRVMPELPVIFTRLLTKRHAQS